MCARTPRCGPRRSPARTAAQSRACRSRCRRRGRHGGACALLQGQQQVPRRPSGRTRSRAARARAPAPAPRRRGSRPSPGWWRRAPRPPCRPGAGPRCHQGPAQPQAHPVRPVARGLRQRRARHEHHARATAGRDQGGVQPGRPGAHDGDVGGLDEGAGDHRAVRYPPRGGAPGPTDPMTRGLYLHHPSSLEHDTGDHPECPARIRAIEQELTGRGWLGLEPQLAPAADRAVVEAVHPAAYVDRTRRCARRGGGMLDMDTVASEGSFEAAARGRRCGDRRVRAGCARNGAHILRAAPARSPCRGVPGDGLLPVQQRGGRRPVCARPVGRRARADPRLGCPPRERDPRHLLRVPEVLYVSIHQSPLYPGTGALTDSGAGAGEGHTVNLPVLPGPATPNGSAWSSTSSRRSRVPTLPTSSSSRPASTPTATIRWPTARSRRSHTRRWPG